MSGYCAAALHLRGHRLVSNANADDRVMPDLPACLPGQGGLRTRISVIMGQRFASEAIELEVVRDHISLKGFAGLPTLNRPTTANIFLFVNGRPIRDRALFWGIRAGYGDTLPRGRHPMAILSFICLLHLLM